MMARLFDDASATGADFAGEAVSALPLTMACWFNSDDATDQQRIMGMSDLVNDSPYIELRGDVAGDPVRLHSLASGADSTIDSSTGYSANTWHHMCAVYANATSRTLYLDGNNVGSDTANSDPLANNAMSHTAVGEFAPTFFAPMSGHLAEGAMWAAALTAAEITLLANSVKPIRVRPAGLAAYWPLMGRNSPEIDLVGGFDLTLTGSPAQSDHPRIISRPPLIPILVASAAAAEAAQTNFVYRRHKRLRASNRAA